MSARRGVSTAVDAGLFVLIVSAAAVTLTLPPPAAPSTGDAGPTADALATITVDAEYALTPADPPVPESAEYDRVAHGPPAVLLARAAVASVAIDGVRSTHTYDGLRAAVANTTRRVADRRAEAVQVRAVWAPYPEAPIAGRVVVGPTPPPGVSVDAATITVPSGVPGVDDRLRAVRATDGGFDAIAGVLADAIVTGLFPPNTTRLALQGDPPVPSLTAHRYRRTATLLDTDVDTAVASRDTERANRRLRRALAARLARDLRHRFDSPRAAIAAVSVASVRIRVRTWSA